MATRKIVSSHKLWAIYDKEVERFCMKVSEELFTDEELQAVNVEHAGIIAIPTYALASYFIIGLLNRSFAIADRNLLVINSHFPLKDLQIFSLDEIQEVKISSNKKMRILMIFCLFQYNYIQIETHSQKKKFYCLFLDVDCYDENWTERTLDDLARSLQLSGINVKLEI